LAILDSYYVDKNSLNKEAASLYGMQLNTEIQCPLEWGSIRTPLGSCAFYYPYFNHANGWKYHPFYKYFSRDVYELFLSFTGPD
jgi:hypothetical protein